MSSRKKLLFVDDEKRLLEGIKRLLRKKRGVWDTFFATSGDDAVEVVKRENISVIIADIRMPGMDGPSVLDEVSKISPKTIRFILSGQACKDQVMRVIQKAHIFLAKPCNQQLLMEVLERACCLHDLLSQSQILEMATKMGKLPSTPALYNKLVEEINSEDVSLDKIGDIVASDPGMCSKILQLVNSAFFSLPRHISTPQQAVNILGVETISSMVLAGEVFDTVDSDLLEKFNLDSMWQHINRVSQIAKSLARREGLTKEQISAASTAALLHEVGTLVVASNAPELYQQVIDKAASEMISIDQAEQQVYQTTSAAIGAYLLGLWGLPNDVIRGVAYHRQPSLDDTVTDEVSTALIVHVADLIDNDSDNDPTTVEQLLDKVELANFRGEQTKNQRPQTRTGALSEQVS